jgi:uncharacterized RDD family membrane protein YckC
MLADHRSEREMMARNSSADAPSRWDLEWEPVKRSGSPDRFPPSPEAAYAEFPVRAIAFGIDALFLWLVLQLIQQARGLVVLWFTRNAPEANDPALVVSAGFVVVALLLVTLSSAYFWRVFRATPGQMVLGLFVVERGSGLRLSRARALVRWLALYAPLAVVLSYTQLIDIVFRTEFAPDSDPLLIASVAFFMPLAWYVVLGLSVLAEGRRGRGLHDRLARSVVVRRAGPPA